MNDEPSGFFRVGSEQEGLNLMNRLMDVASPKSVFGEPVTRDNYQIFTASEVMTGMGYGFGSGEGPGMTASAEAPAAVEEGEAGRGGYGSGGGGGGYSMGRPVAVVVLGSSGVEVQPVVDITKIGIAFLTTIGAMMLAFSRMSRARRSIE